VTYATDAELIAYAAARGVTITALEAPILLTKAGDWLQIQPITVPDPVPDQIKQAQMVCAMIYRAGGDPLAAITRQVLSQTVFGAVSRTFSDKGPSAPLYPQLIALFRPYLTAGSMGSANFRVQRV
jgi:hypothetical protein